jgi:hypothetical protein
MSLFHLIPLDFNSPVLAFHKFLIPFLYIYNKFAFFFEKSLYFLTNRISMSCNLSILRTSNEAPFSNGSYTFEYNGKTTNSM